jgi:uncharacterized protein YecT (DUF1311 family)
MKNDDLNSISQALRSRFLIQSDNTINMICVRKKHEWTDRRRNKQFYCLKIRMNNSNQK